MPFAPNWKASLFSTVSRGSQRQASSSYSPQVWSVGILVNRAESMAASGSYLTCFPCFPSGWDVWGWPTKNQKKHRVLVEQEG